MQFGISAENLAYGQYPDDTFGTAVMRQFIVDDGNGPDWGHRRNAYNKELSHIGIAVGCHGFWGDIVCIQYAGRGRDYTSSVPTID